ncbi:transposase [Streptomyces sp. NPDC088337]|uniref:transposase n=1 Tax=unclassified Streptomyces TaxID=2593676 RepID=UPI002DDADDCA|nr:transposase [Streptomyces sp. NBC_01788]WSB25522.1 transposase [Streptomyces sp. NBC_01788]
MVDGEADFRLPVEEALLPVDRQAQIVQALDILDARITHANAEASPQLPTRPARTRLATTPLEWRRQIRYVAIDMSPGYRTAIHTGLPHATVVVDHFHMVQLANKMLNIVRRRTTVALRGRRGRARDPEWKVRRRLLRNREDLTDTQFTRCGTY